MSGQPYGSATVEVWQNNVELASASIINSYDGVNFKHLIENLPAGTYDVKVYAANTPGEPGYGTEVIRFKIPSENTDGFEDNLNDIEKIINIYLREGIENIRFTILNYLDETPIPHSDIAYFKFAGIVGVWDAMNEGEFDVPWAPIGTNKAVVIPTDTDTWQTIRVPQLINSGHTGDIPVYMYPPIDLRVAFKDGVNILTNGTVQFFVTEDGDFWEPIDSTLDNEFNHKIEKASNGIIKYRFEHPDLAEVAEGTFNISFTELVSGQTVLYKEVNVGSQVVDWAFIIGKDTTVTFPTLTNGVYSANLGTNLAIKAKLSGFFQFEAGYTYSFVVRRDSSTGQTIASKSLTENNEVTLPVLQMNTSRTVWVGIRKESINSNLEEAGTGTATSRG